MRSIPKLFPTILILSCFFLIGLGFQGAVFAGAIQLPQTGQTTCYDSSGAVKPCAGTGQDGELKVGVAWPTPRFTVSGECVIDNLTGLMWAKSANLPNGSRTWQQALDFAKGLSLCGYSDWRLPNVNELESLVHADQFNPATWLNTQGFTTVQSDDYWSSSSLADEANNAWIVGMLYGYVYFDYKDFNYYVWPVRSGQ